MDSRKIQPFEIKINSREVEDLINRIKSTRWPDENFMEDWSRGIPTGYLKKIADYWANQFDWRVQEAKLNDCPQFMVEIEGQPIHFYHVKSGHKNAVPLLLLHGYPSSFVEMTNMIDLLTNPDVHNGQSPQAFHVVVPSLPGYGFSRPLHSKGWDIYQIARAFVDLMHLLGYDKYGVHAGDIGAGVAQWMGNLDPDHISGLHINADALSLAILGTTLPSTEDAHLSETARKRIEKLHMVQKEGRGYLQLQSTRPLTISYALSDSPVGLLAWIAEKFKEWADDSIFPDGIHWDILLTNVCIYWFTKTSFSAANLIYENYHSSSGWAPPGNVPTGFSVFDTDGIVKNAYNPENIIKHWSEFEKGGHFPALEVPLLLADDIRAFFKSL